MKFPLFHSLWRVNSPSFPQTQHTASSDLSFFFHFFVFLCISVWCRSSRDHLCLLSMLLWLSIRKKNVLHVLSRLFLSSLVFSPNNYEICTSVYTCVCLCVCGCRYRHICFVSLSPSVPTPSLKTLFFGQRCKLGWNTDKYTNTHTHTHTHTHTPKHTAAEYILACF